MTQPDFSSRSKVPQQNAPNATSNKTESSIMKKIWGLVLLLVILTGGGIGLWVLKDPEVRTQLSEHATDIPSAVTIMTEAVTRKLNDATRGTRDWIGSVRTRLTSPPPPSIGSGNGMIPGAPPHAPSINTPEDLDRIIAEPGPVVEGGASERGAIAPRDERADPPVPPDAGRKDDAVVRTDFITDLASWMVKGYAPSPRSGRPGTVSASLQSGNLRYGAGMKGLAWIGEDISKGRSAALNHVFTPDMLNALYQLYLDHFLDAVKDELGKPNANGTPLTPQQRADFYQQYSNRFRAVAGALQSIASIPDFTKQLDDLRSASQKVIDTNATYSELVFALDDAREKKETQTVDRLLKQVEDAGQLYRQSVLQRERAYAAVAQLLRNNPVTQSLDNDTLFYIAQWIERRVRKNPEKMNATLQGATLFLDLANQFEQAAGASIQ